MKIQKPRFLALGIFLIGASFSQVGFASSAQDGLNACATKVSSALISTLGSPVISTASEHQMLTAFDRNRAYVVEVIAKLCAKQIKAVVREGGNHSAANKIIQSVIDLASYQMSMSSNKSL